ncbi:MAG: GFA family protein [Candidatus Pelagibacter sp.]
MKKLTCHCGEVQAEVNVPGEGFKKVMRCNCSICKRKGYIIGVVGSEDFKIIKGEDFLTLYQFKTKTAQHYFCKVCGIHTHNRPRINPKIYGVNIACVEGVKPFEIKDVPVNDGENHPLDQK